MMNVSVSNKHNTTWKMLCMVFPRSLFLYQNLTLSIEVRQQLVRKYRTPALSMKYSICITYVAGAWKWYEVREGGTGEGRGS